LDDDDDDDEEEEEEDISMAWEDIRENIKISVKASLGLYKLKAWRPAILTRLTKFSFLAYLQKESRLIRSPVCLSVCPPLITFESLGRI
jgi:hypothetical protein